MLIEIVNLRFEVMNVLAPFENDLRTESQSGHLIDQPGHQHDAALGGESRGNDPSAATDCDPDQDVVDQRRKLYVNSITQAPLRMKKTTERL